MGERAFLGLGTNLGDRLANLQLAVDLLAATPGIRFVRSSRIYETAPVGPPQPDFLNAVVEVDTDLEPHDLLAAGAAVERELHRVRDVHWGPRTIDVDMLVFDERTIDDAGPGRAAPTDARARVRPRAAAGARGRPAAAGRATRARPADRRMVRRRAAVRAAPDGCRDGRGDLLPVRLGGRDRRGRLPELRGAAVPPSPAARRRPPDPSGPRRRPGPPARREPEFLPRRSRRGIRPRGRRAGRTPSRRSSVLAALVTGSLWWFLRAHEVPPGVDAAAPPPNGHLVYTAVGEGGERLWSWDPRTGTTTEGPAVDGDVVQLVSAQGALSGWLGLTTRTSDGRLEASILRTQTPDALQTHVITGDLLAWGPNGADRRHGRSRRADARVLREPRRPPGAARPRPVRAGLPAHAVLRQHPDDRPDPRDHLLHVGTRGRHRRLLPGQRGPARDPPWLGAPVGLADLRPAGATGRGPGHVARSGAAPPSPTRIAAAASRPSS